MSGRGGVQLAVRRVEQLHPQKPAGRMRHRQQDQEQDVRQAGRGTSLREHGVFLLLYLCLRTLTNNFNFIILLKIF